MSNTWCLLKIGLYAPDSGVAHILGKNIRTEMDEIRASLGFCPQHVNNSMAVLILSATF